MVEPTQQFQYVIPHDKKLKYEFDAEQQRDMTTGFKGYDSQGNGSIIREKAKQLLVDLGFRETTEEQVDKELTALGVENKDVISWAQFIDLYGEFDIIHGASRNTITSLAVVDTQVRKRRGSSIQFKSGAKTFIAEEEINVITFYINNKLEEDTDEMLQARLPIKPDGEQLFYSMNDGLILIKLLEMLQGDIIDMKRINKYVEGMNPLYIKTNLCEAIEAFNKVFKLVGISDTCFSHQNKTMVTSVLLNIIHKLNEEAINIKACPRLYRLQSNSAETNEDFESLPTEEVLIRWVNHQLKEAGQELRISNLGKDLTDSVALTHVLVQLDKMPATDNEDRQERTSLLPLEEEDLVKRAELLIEQTKLIGMKQICLPQDIVKGNSKVGAMLVAAIFNYRPGLEWTNEELEELNRNDGIYGHGWTFKNWINSLGITDVNIKHNVFEEMNQFMTLLKICDHLSPGSVDWSEEQNLNTAQHWNHALEIVDKIFESAQGKSFKLNEQMLLRLTISLDRYRYYNWLGLEHREDILEWCAARVHLPDYQNIDDGFADKRWADGKWVMKLLHKLHPEQIDMEQVNANDPETNAKLALDKAHDFGVKIYCEYDDLMKPCRDSMRVLVAGILSKHVEKAGGLLSSVLD